MVRHGESGSFLIEGNQAHPEQTAQTDGQVGEMAGVVLQFAGEVEPMANIA